VAKDLDYTRVCEKCGASWFLPKELATAKAPSSLQVKSMQRSTRLAIGRQRERYSMQAMALQSAQDRVLSAAQCPACGSSNYTQYKPGKAPNTTSPVIPAPIAPDPSPNEPPLASAAPIRPPQGRWHPDPLGRHEHRYWDGASWTSHVSDQGIRGTDPMA
jgi:predicted nucleic-acid-binding Zn-ribbon protein